MSTIYEKYCSTNDRIADNTIQESLKKNRIDMRFLECNVWYVALIRHILQEQRAKREEAWLIPFKQIADHTRKEAIEKQWPSDFYYAQRAFSLPVDYVYRPEDLEKKRREYYDALVFQPEFIRDDFLIDIGLMDESDRLPSLAWKTLENKSLLQESHIEKVASLIPALKHLLAESRSIQTGIWKRMSWRVLAIPNGKYIVYQERKTQGEEKNKPNIEYIPHVYSDMYSLLRWMTHSSKWLDEWLWKMPKLQAELNSLYANWNIISLELKQNQIQEILGVISKHTNPYISHARERLRLIEYKNPIHDSARVLGAANDIGKYIHTNEGKQSSCRHQERLFHHHVNNEEIQYDTFALSLLSHLWTIDEWEMLTALWVYKKKTTLSEYDLDHEITQAIQTIRNYVNEWNRSGFVGMPYSLLRQELEIILDWVSKKENKDRIRVLYKSILIMKKFSFFLSLYKVKHLLNTKKTSEIMLDELTKTEKILTDNSFLPQIELRDSGKKKFGYMLGCIHTLRWLITENWKESEAIEYIENMGV